MSVKCLKKTQPIPLFFKWLKYIFPSVDFKCEWTHLLSVQSYQTWLVWAYPSSSSSTAKFRTVFLLSFLSGVLSFLGNWFLEILRGMFYWRDAGATVNQELMESSAFCSSFILCFAWDIYSGQSCIVVEIILHEKSVTRSIFNLTGKQSLLKLRRICLFHRTTSCNPFPVLCSECIKNRMCKYFNLYCYNVMKINFKRFLLSRF
jgi:hypothetical protein